MRNFNPGAPPNVTVGPQGFHRMMIPDQTNWFLSYSPLDSPNYSSPCVQVTFFVCYSQSLQSARGGRYGIPTYLKLKKQLPIYGQDFPQTPQTRKAHIPKIRSKYQKPHILT